MGRQLIIVDVQFGVLKGKNCLKEVLEDLVVEYGKSRFQVVPV